MKCEHKGYLSIHVCLRCCAELQDVIMDARAEGRAEGWGMAVGDCARRGCFSCTEAIRSASPTPPTAPAKRDGSIEAIQEHCPDLRHVCGKCGFRGPDRSAYDEQQERIASLTATVARYEAALREIGSRRLTGDGAVAFEGLKRVARAALDAKPGKGETK